MIVMAGSGGEEDKDALLEYANVEYKALIELGGKTILERVLAAINESGVVTKTYVIGLPENKITIPEGMDPSTVKCLEIEGADVPTRLDEATKFVMEEAKSDPSLFPHGSYHGLFCSGDIPFLKGEMIRDFVEQCGDLENDLYPSIVREEVMVKRFPESKRTYGKITEGRYCVGDVHIFDYSMVEARLDRVRVLRKNRKNFAMTVFRLKPSIVFRFLIGRLGMKHLVKATNKVFKVHAEFISTKYAELAMDVDKPHQLELAKAEFKS